MDEAYQYFCCSIIQAEKRFIPSGLKNNYRPCWDAECESLYPDFLKEPSSKESNKASSDLLDQIDEKSRERWLEVVNTITFTKPPVGWHGIPLTTWLDGPETLAVFAPFQKTQLHHCWREIGCFKRRIASQPDSWPRKYLTFGEFQLLVSVRKMI